MASTDLRPALERATARTILLTSTGSSEPLRLRTCMDVAGIAAASGTEAGSGSWTGSAVSTALLLCPLGQETVGDLRAEVRPGHRQCSDSRAIIPRSPLRCSPGLAPEFPDRWRQNTL